MPRSLPTRAVWPNLFPGLSLWLTFVGVLLSGISLVLTGISDLNWWVKVGLCLIAFVLPLLAYAVWRYLNILLQKVKQYDLLYDDLISADTDYQQLQGNLAAFNQILRAAGVQMFEVTGLAWGNRSPLVVIACDQQVLVGSKLAIINIFTLNTLGRFEVVRPVMDGYLVREDLILDPVWWGYLREEATRNANPRISNAVAVLLR